MDLIRTSVGVSDIADDETTRFAEETLHRSTMVNAPELRRHFKAALTSKEISSEEFEPGIFWPVPFAEKLEHTYEAYGDKVRKMFGEVAGGIYQYTSGAYRELYWTTIPMPILRRTRIYPRHELRRFILVSRHAVQSAILQGNQAVISRVLETDVGWAIAPLVPYLDAVYKSPTIESRQEPACLFFLSPNRDPDYGVVRIGRNEAMHLSKHPEKKKILNPRRGISWIPDVTSLRHLRLHARTMAALLFLKRAFPGFVEVFFRKDIADARCNITLAEREMLDAEREILEAFFVQLERYEIGLDSAFYRVLDPSFALALYRHTVDKQKRIVLDEEKIISELSESAKIESEMVEKNNWVELEDEIIVRQALSFPPWIDEPEKRRPTSYTIEDMLQRIGRTEAKIDLDDLTRVLDVLSMEQRIIEQELMPHLRLILEH